MKIFNVALGRAFASKVVEGKLYRAEMPPVFSLEDLREIATEFNDIWPPSKDPDTRELVPVGLIVRYESDENPLSKKPEHLEVEFAGTLLKYRHLTRFALVSNECTNIYSFTSTFTHVLATSKYPEDLAGGLTLQDLSNASLTVIYDSLDLAGIVTESEHQSAVKRLAEVYKVLSLSHKELSDISAADWNELWVRHVSIGLDLLLGNLRTLIASAGNSHLFAFLAKYTYASFGLATPKNNYKFDKKESNLGKDVAKALDSWWANKDQVLSTLEILRSHPDTKQGTHPLEDLNWDTFEREQLGSGNPLFGFQAMASTGSIALEAFADFTERQFFSPLNSKNPTQIQVFDDEGESLKVTPISGKSIHLANFAEDEIGKIYSENLQLRIPTLGTVSQDLFDSSSVNLLVKSPAVSWVGKVELVENGNLIVFHGHFELLDDFDFKKAVVNLITIQLSVSSADGLQGLIDPRANCKIGFVPETGSGLALWQNGRDLKAIKQIDFNESSGSTETEINLNPKQKDLVFFVWAETCSLDSIPLEPYSERMRWFSSSTVVQDRASIKVGENNVNVGLESDDEGEQSPVIAAIYKKLLTKDPISPDNENSFAGNLEKKLVEYLSLFPLMNKSSHFVVAEGEHYGLASSVVKDGLVFQGGCETAFANLTSFRVPKEILESSEATSFFESFRDLEIEESLKARSIDSSRWDYPSRTSWKNLSRSRKPQLMAYLASYRALVRKAKELADPDAIFWATYPFSFSVWDLKDSGSCKAVFLSPLHPIRLAWLSSVEHVLEMSSESELLAGGVEGWNLPIWGPSPKRGGALLAAAMDNGEGQLFLGWSCLVKVSSSDPESLSLPRYAGQLETPGTSAGGLNASAATAALVNYGRINPHVSTLTIDLAAINKSSRLFELDEAVNNLSKKWNEQTSSSLPGGFRVFDSLNRLGNPKTNLVSALVHSKVPTPLVWARYEPRDGSGVNCNVRLLQDSGVKLAIAMNSEGEHGRGLVAEVPLRRFEAFEISNSDPRFGLNFPSLVKNPAGGEFYRALEEVESFAKESHIISEVQNAALVDKTAEWIVTGEGMISPSSISRMIQAKADSNQMLWEWKPPFFDAKSGDMLERRPFLALARIPQSFKNELARIQKRSFGENIDAGFTDSLLEKLGTRGVGLSSLLARGGTHASGALGFYLCLETIDALKIQDIHLMVLPIDACDPFLRALSGNGSSMSDMTRRADLLLLAVTQDRITLIPIEIKFYGTEAKAEGKNLPTPLSSKVKDAFDQVAQTRSILDLLVTRYRNLKKGDNGKEGDLDLWVNSFATMLEAAFKMSPNVTPDKINLAQVLSNVLSKQIEIDLGASLVTYYEDAASTENGLGHTKYFGNHEKRVPGLFVANPKSCLVNDEPGHVQPSVIAEMQKLVEWALNTETKPSPRHDFTPESDDQGTSTEEDSSPESNQLSDNGETLTETETPEPSSYSDEAGTKEAEPIADDVEYEYLSGLGIEIRVGTTVDGLVGRNVDATFWPANTELNQMNVGVVGDLGTGKTQLLKSLILQLSQKSREVQIEPISMLIFDYKDDYTDEEFVNRVGANVVSPEKIPLNIFELSGPYTKRKAALRASKFADMLGRIYAGIGTIQVHNLTVAITELFENLGGKPPTLNEVLAQYQSKVKNVDAVISTLSRFTIQDIFTENKDEMISFREFMDGRLNVIPLTNFNGDSETQNAIVVLFLDLYYEYMLKSKKWDFVGTSPQLRMVNSFLLVDEAHSIMKYEFPVLDDILLKGRQFGFGVILASQYLSHFKTKNKNYGEPLLTWIIHKVPQAKESELKSLGIVGANAEMAKKISSLPVHGAFYSSLNFENRFIRGLPFYELS